MRIGFMFFCFYSLVAHANDNFDLQGHRGARGLSPENTLPSFIEALKYGVTTMEMDVVLTKDKKVILSHEPWMNPEICLSPEGGRLGKLTPIRHNIYRMNYEEVQKYDCGSIVHPRFPDQQLQKLSKPTLKEVITQLQLYLEENKLPAVRYNIEIKCYKMGTLLMHPRPKKFAEYVMKELKTLGILDYTIIQSFDVRPLKHIRKNYPNIPISLLIDNPLSFEKNLKKLGFIPEIYSPKYTLVNSSLVKEAHQKGIKIIPWTVNLKENIEKIIRLEVDGLITDYPNIAKEVDFSLKLEIE